MGRLLDRAALNARPVCPVLDSVFRHMFRNLQTLLFAAALLLGAGTACAIEGDQPGIFAFGGIGFAGATSPGELKFAEIMTSDDPEAGFRQWFEGGGNVGKAYAMVACYYLDPDRYERMKERFAEEHLQVPALSGCILYNINHEQLTENIEDGQYDAVVKPLLPEDARAKHFPEESVYVFAFCGVGIGGTEPPGLRRFNQMMASPDPITFFENWYATGTPAERAYALVAIYNLDPDRYLELKATMQSHAEDLFPYQAGCIGSAMTYGQLFEQIDDGLYDRKLQNPPTDNAPSSNGDKVDLFIEPPAPDDPFAPLSGTPPPPLPDATTPPAPDPSSPQ